jgi:hypothetical protein
VPGESVVFYHRNDDSKDASYFSQTLHGQNLHSPEMLQAVHDPITNRTIGAAVFGAGLKRVSPLLLQSAQSAKSFTVGYTALTMQDSSTASEGWIARIQTQITAGVHTLYTVHSYTIHSYTHTPYALHRTLIHSYTHTLIHHTLIHRTLIHHTPYTIRHTLIHSYTVHSYTIHPYPYTHAPIHYIPYTHPTPIHHTLHSDSTNSTNSDSKYHWQYILQYHCNITTILLQYYCNITAILLQYHCHITTGIPPPAAHAAWWDRFWDRSFIRVGTMADRSKGCNAPTPTAPWSCNLFGCTCQGGY